MLVIPGHKQEQFSTSIFTVKWHEQPPGTFVLQGLNEPLDDRDTTVLTDSRAIGHDILHFCARVLATSRVTARDSSAALLDLRGCRDV